MWFSNLSKHAQGGLGDARNYGKFNLKVKSEPQGQRNKVITSSQALTHPHASSEKLLSSRAPGTQTPSSLGITPRYSPPNKPTSDPTAMLCKHAGGHNLPFSPRIP